jgi:hypothetical protein
MNLVLKTAGLSALLLVAAAFTMPSGSVLQKTSSWERRYSWRGQSPIPAVIIATPINL